MRELTMHELDAELAEQLPARELMNCCYGRQTGGAQTNQTNVAYQANGNQVQSSSGVLSPNVGLNVSNNNIGFGYNSGILQGNFAG